MWGADKGLRIVDVHVAMSRSPIPQTHENGKAFPGLGSGSGVWQEKESPGLRMNVWLILLSTIAFFFRMTVAQDYCSTNPTHTHTRISKPSLHSAVCNTLTEFLGCQCSSFRVYGIPEPSFSVGVSFVFSLPVAPQSGQFPNLAGHSNSVSFS